MRPGYKTKIIYYKYCPLLANLCKIIDFSECVNEQNFFSMEKDHQKFESQISPQQIKLDMGNEEDSRQKLLLDFFFLFWFEQAVGIVHSGEETLEEERVCGGEIRTWIQIGAWEV